MEKQLRILFADDDEDDRLFFAEALDKLNIPNTLETVVDGEKLINHLRQNTTELPDVLFLDINMPRKKGPECLSEIKSNKTLKQIPVIIYSTCLDDKVADDLYQKGAHYYMQKSEFTQLRKHLQYVLQLMIATNFERPSRNSFVVHLPVLK